MQSFYECESPCEITIPPAVKVIKDEAFMYCSELTTVILHAGLEEIGVNAFGQCTYLPEISIPTAIKAIKNWAFYLCSQLTNVNLGEGIEEIGEDAFADAHHSNI